MNKNKKQIGIFIGLTEKEHKIIKFLKTQRAINITQFFKNAIEKEYLKTENP